MWDHVGYHGSSLAILGLSWGHLGSSCTILGHVRVTSGPYWATSATRMAHDGSQSHRAASPTHTSDFDSAEDPGHDAAASITKDMSGCPARHTCLFVASAAPANCMPLGPFFGSARIADSCMWRFLVCSVTQNRSSVKPYDASKGLMRLLKGLMEGGEGLIRLN